MTYNKEVVVVGAGLAGSEAAYQLAKRGIKVKLYEMKKIKKTYNNCFNFIYVRFNLFNIP